MIRLSNMDQEHEFYFTALTRSGVRRRFRGRKIGETLSGVWVQYRPPYSKKKHWHGVELTPGTLVEPIR